MDHTRLRNRFLRDKSTESKHAYNHQRNYCLSLIRKGRDYCSNLDHKNITNNKLFWKTIKLRVNNGPFMKNLIFFSEKGSGNEKMTSIENDSILDDIEEISEVFNKFFSTMASRLNIPKLEDQLIDVKHIEDPLEKLIGKYKTQPSILAIHYRGFKNIFSFKPISNQEIEKEILKSDGSKACQDSDIPIKLVKMNVDTFTENLFREINKSLELYVSSPLLRKW